MGVGGDPWRGGHGLPGSRRGSGCGLWIPGPRREWSWALGGIERGQRGGSGACAGGADGIAGRAGCWKRAGHLDGRLQCGNRVSVGTFRQWRGMGVVRGSGGQCDVPRGYDGFSRKHVCLPGHCPECLRCLSGIECRDHHGPGCGSFRADGIVGNRGVASPDQPELGGYIRQRDGIPCGAFDERIHVDAGGNRGRERLGLCLHGVGFEHDLLLPCPGL